MTKYSRETKNYILITMGSAVICLMFMFHLMVPFANLLVKYNRLVDYVNKTYDGNHSHASFFFFGEKIETIAFLIDIIIVASVIIVVLIVYLSIRWSVKRNE